MPIRGSGGRPRARRRRRGGARILARHGYGALATTSPARRERTATQRPRRQRPAAGRGALDSLEQRARRGQPHRRIRRRARRRGPARSRRAGGGGGGRGGGSEGGRGRRPPARPRLTTAPRAPSKGGRGKGGRSPPACSRRPRVARGPDRARPSPACDRRRAWERCGADRPHAGQHSRGRSHRGAPGGGRLRVRSAASGHGALRARGDREIPEAGPPPSLRARPAEYGERAMASAITPPPAEAAPRAPAARRSRPAA